MLTSIASDHSASFRRPFGAQIIAREIDVNAIEQETGVGAEVYGIDYLPCHDELKIQGSEESFRFGNYELKCRIAIPFNRVDGWLDFSLNCI